MNCIQTPSTLITQHVLGFSWTPILNLNLCPLIKFVWPAAIGTYFTRVLNKTWHVEDSYLRLQVGSSPSHRPFPQSIYMIPVVVVLLGQSAIHLRLDEAGGNSSLPGSHKYEAIVPYFSLGRRISICSDCLNSSHLIAKGI